jgi:hypothetical protein
VNATNAPSPEMAAVYDGPLPLVIGLVARVSRS